MTAHRFSFYEPTLCPADATTEITGDEHHHLMRVLRLSPGAEILVTNGRGLVIAGAVETVGRDGTVVRLCGVIRNAGIERRLVLALGLLPRAHFDTAVAQCVEVGVTDFIPLVARKGHVREWTRTIAERTARVAVAAMKQSGRGWLPEVHTACDVDELAAFVPRYHRAVLADQGAPALDAAARPGDVLAIVGPEGGFSEDEVRALTGAGAERASVSAYRLRAETAAVVLASALARGAPDTRGPQTPV